MSIGCARVSPLASRIAQAQGIDLADIAGTGRDGRIMRADLRLVPRSPTLAPAGASVPRSTGSRHFLLTARCRLDNLLTLRDEMNQALSARHIRIGVNDMLVKAVALALAAVPEANVPIAGETLHRSRLTDIAIAVAAKGGLALPVLRNVGALSLSAIARGSGALADKARSGDLAPVDITDSTAALCNLGLFGIDELIPVLDPPRALMLGIGTGIEQPWKVDGEMALATVVTITGSFDQSAIDGTVAADFMAALRSFIETPLSIIV